MAKKKVSVQKFFEVAVAARRNAWESNLFEERGGYTNMWEDVPTFDDVWNAADAFMHDCARIKSLMKTGVQKVFEDAVIAEVASRKADLALERVCSLELGRVVEVVMEAAGSDEEKPLWDVWKDVEIKPVICEKHAAELAAKESANAVN
jgi:hypothetical protein